MGVNPDGGSIGQLQGLLQNASIGGEPAATPFGERYVYFLGFSGKAKSAVTGAPLGINPGGAFNNAVDIRAQAIGTDQRKGRPGLEHVAYRFRQTAQQRSWELVEGVWHLVYATKSAEPDDPDPLSQKIELPEKPYLRMFDSPGWPLFVLKSQKLLPLGGGRTNQVKATQVVVQMYCKTVCPLATLV